MKLYYMPGACSLASHILLREANLPVELERVGRDKKTEHGEDFLAVNPKGYVPALRMEDGDILTENVVVHGYIADLKPESKLAPAHGTKARVKQDELAVYISTEIHKSYGPLFNPAITEDARKATIDKLHSRYKLIEQILADGRTYLTGPQFATVDAYLFTVTNWANMLKVDVSAFPNLLAYQARVAARPAVQAALVAEGLAKAA
ncbi:MAG: glutathione transferase GstA [Burkholderiales bacterium]|jgi:glutathione S-transferase|nr:MAG: glutathione transferase GstA [Burkholderiales bacterium]